MEFLVPYLAKKAGLSKNVHPHLLRHSRLTHLAKNFTESELKVIAGWTGDSRMAGIYIHLSGADIEKKVLELAGLISREDAQKEDSVLNRLRACMCFLRSLKLHPSLLMNVALKPSLVCYNDANVVTSLLLMNVALKFSTTLAS